MARAGLIYKHMYQVVTETGFAAALMGMYDDLPLPVARIIAGMGLNDETAYLY